MIRAACIVLAVVATAAGLPAHADSNVQTIAEAYHAVMAAQYAAHQPPPPIRAEEAQKIYDSYLAGIAKPKSSPDAPGSTAGAPAQQTDQP